MTPTMSSTVGSSPTTPVGVREAGAGEETQYTVGQRQLAALGFILVVAIGFVATMAYIAGRVVRGEQPRTVAAAPLSSKTPAQAPVAQVPPPVAVKPVEALKPSAPKVEQLIVVEPPVAAVVGQAASAGQAKASPAASPASAATAVPPAPSAAAATPQSAPFPAVTTRSDLTGKLFWQVAAVDRGMADVSCEFLTKKGIPAKLGDESSPGIFRVLVGPLTADAEISDLKVKLEGEGFKPFLRRY